MAENIETRVAIVAERILLIRGCRVMLDRDLADLYGVSTKRLNEQVKRNIRRFPADFAFRLSAAEKAKVVANCDHLASLRFSPQCPMAFTEHGAIMLASVLNSPRAIAVSVVVVRAFVHLRQLIGSHKQLADRLARLEKRLASHDIAIIRLFASIRELMTEPAASPRPIGFTADIK
jgi:hypothetical protein